MGPILRLETRRGRRFGRDISRKHPAHSLRLARQRKNKCKKSNLREILEILRHKIHKARVTAANLDYIGSILIDEDLVDKIDT